MPSVPHPWLSILETGIRQNQIASKSMSLGLTFLNSSANQYQAQMVDSMHVGQGHNLLKGTSQDVLETPPYISQSALLCGKCDSLRLGGFGVRLEPGAGKSVGLKKQQAVWTNPLQPSLWASVSPPIPHTSSPRLPSVFVELSVGRLCKVKMQFVKRFH